MIHGISANQLSFHPVAFTRGLNVILAERKDTSTQKDTRNGLGKSTLVDIIDFCLGSSAKNGSGLCITPLKEWSFTLDITLADNRVQVTRAVGSPQRIVVEGPTVGWIEQPDLDQKTGARVFNLSRWRALLGWALFGLARFNDTHKYKPSYRSLISYFIRHGPDAYTGPFRHSREQQPWDIQLNAGFLLGLNWENASRLQELKDQEKGIKAIEAAIKTGAMADVLGSIGELEAQRVQLAEQVEREYVALASFRVHPQYEAVQHEANQITATVHALANENIAARQRLSRYMESVADEKPPSDTAFERLYEEAGFVFPTSVRKTLAEAREFHHQIIENRKAFLETEIKRLGRQLHGRDEQIRELTDARAVSLELLSSHGALQEMVKLQERFVETRGRLDRVRAKISETKDLTSRKREIKIAKTELVEVAEQDHEQRRDVWTTAVRLFNDNSQALYNTPGRLVIDITETGYKFDVEIERSGSEGIGKMKVFCLDLTLLQLSATQQGRLDFLVHDSALYDGVDSRQRALALERASAVSDSIEGQYICSLNSDMLPRGDFSENFDIDEYVRLRLTDEDPSGSLLGFHFERPVAQ